MQPFEIFTPSSPNPGRILKKSKFMNYPIRPARSQVKNQLNTRKTDGDVSQLTNNYNCDLTEEVMRMLKLSLTEFSLPKFYQLFGISKVKSAAVSAFRSSYQPGDRSFAYMPPEQERMSLQSLEVITDALLEIMEVSGWGTDQSQDLLQHCV